MSTPGAYARGEALVLERLAVSRAMPDCKPQLFLGICLLLSPTPFLHNLRCTEEEGDVALTTEQGPVWRFVNISKDQRECLATRSSVSHPCHMCVHARVWGYPRSRYQKHGHGLEGQEQREQAGRTEPTATGAQLTTEQRQRQPSRTTSAECSLAANTSRLSLLSPHWGS